MAGLKRKYMAADDMEVKRAIIEVIVKDIHKQGGRFLEREQGAHSWKVMEFDEARKQISQALRERKRLSKQSRNAERKIQNVIRSIVSFFLC